jgi:hypothetical protein
VFSFVFINLRKGPDPAMNTENVCREGVQRFSVVGVWICEPFKTHIQLCMAQLESPRLDRLALCVCVREYTCLCFCFFA